MTALGFSVEPLRMKDPIHRHSRRASLLAGEQKCEPLGILATAFEARPVACSEGGNFVEEEQFGVVAAPDAALTALELQHATDPLARHPASRSERLVVAMKFSAAIS